MNLIVGLRVFHNGIPIELLYREAATPRSEVWMVRPLFVTGPDRLELFEPHDRMTFLHSRAA